MGGRLARRMKVGGTLLLRDLTQEAMTLWQPWTGEHDIMAKTLPFLIFDKECRRWKRLAARVTAAKKNTRSSVSDKTKTIAQLRDEVEASKRCNCGSGSSPSTAAQSSLGGGAVPFGRALPSALPAAPTSVNARSGSQGR